MKTLFAALVGFVFLLSMATVHSATYYFHNDHLGTPQVVTDSTQAVVWQGDYDPFGKATETVAKVEQNLRFPGQYLDRESGLHYNYFRTYDPSIGRYTQSDPIGLEGGVSTYGYAYQNSLRYTDPDGLNPVAGCLAGAWAGPFGCGVGAAVLGSASLAAMLSLRSDSVSLDSTQDQSCEANSDNDRCRELLLDIERFKNGISRRIRQLNENAGGIDQATHIRQLKERQHGLRKRLNEAASLGCKVPSDAWYWASY